MLKRLRGKVLFISLLGSGALAALLAIGQIWFDFMAWDVFIKALITIGIVGMTAGFLVAVDYDAPASREKILLGATVLLILTMSGLVVAQLWWLALPWQDFARIFGTVLILFVLVSFVLAVKEDFGTGRKLKDDNYLD